DPKQVVADGTETINGKTFNKWTDVPADNAAKAKGIVVDVHGVPWPEAGVTNPKPLNKTFDDAALRKEIEERNAKPIYANDQLDANKVVAEARAKFDQAIKGVFRVHDAQGNEKLVDGDLNDLNQIKTPGGKLVDVIQVPVEPTHPDGPKVPGYVKPGTNLPVDPNTGLPAAGTLQTEIKLVG
ncbi:hypothetical protein, partial [Pseudomonas khavaziana]|uniref:hypothetical protein n=1 Tax=Pseudomonas khavaziana TaxID=2842351 RepID=UPI001C3D3BF4